ncbi:hypothetical protein KP509_11G040100 [Ceratopteris richardii]|nr:hypothetical protein KP509_11G040100 [Ceratopteris richardii]
MAFAERDAAISERNNAMAALENAREHRILGWNHFKMQPDVKGKDPSQLQISLLHGPFNAEDPHTFNYGHSMLDFANNDADRIQISEQPQQSRSSKSRKRDNANKAKRVRKIRTITGNDVSNPERKKKRSDTSSESQDRRMPLILPVVPYLGQESEQPSQNDERRQLLQDQKELNFTVTTPIPYCSCTGTAQPCYRWGNGGWQSACCTNTLSIYPLPMNPLKRGYRFPGRKMSAGAFQKLVKRLVEEGVDLSQPVDLKHYWAKHGTNRYITIK